MENLQYVLGAIWLGIRLAGSSYVIIAFVFGFNLKNPIWERSGTLSALRYGKRIDRNDLSEDAIGLPIAILALFIFMHSLNGYLLNGLEPVSKEAALLLLCSALVTFAIWGFFCGFFLMQMSSVMKKD